MMCKSQQAERGVRSLKFKRAGEEVAGIIINSPTEPFKASLSHDLTLAKKPFSKILRRAALLLGVFATIARIILFRRTKTWFGMEGSDANCKV
jgi:hypothetical protein